MERLKREASSLARLRHPSILQLVEPVEETRGGGLMFATEAVLASLSGALAQKDRASSNNRRYDTPSATASNAVEVDELEVQKGLLQVAKGLEFLHDSAKLVHGNLTPDALFINAKSDWKISGLGFAGPPSNAEGHQTLPQLSLSEVLYNDPRLPPSVQLNLDYTSPDFVLDSNINFAADMFSLGLVLIACYREPHRSPIETHGNQSTYKKIMSSTSSAPGPNNNFGCQNRLARELESALARVLARRPTGRMTSAEFQQSEYFDNILVNTMRFLDSLPAKTAAEKQQFMRGLPRIMPQFPVSVLEKKMLSVLLDELKDKELLSLILQNIFQIVRMVPSRKDVLASKILPVLKEIFTAQSKTQERDTSKEAGLVVFLENIQVISENSSAQQFKEDALPIIHAAMQSPTHSLVDAALGTLSTILPVLDFSTVKHDLFPVIANVFSKTSSLGIKVRGLEALAVLCGATEGAAAGSHDDLSGISNSQEPPKSNTSSLDKFTMQEKVVPLLKGIKTKEPAVMMTALKVFQQVARLGDIEYLANEVMPVLWSFALGPLLDLAQFKAYTDVINAVSQKIQKEQVKKLKELATVNKTVLGDRNRESSLSNPILTPSNNTNGTGAETDFEKLVLGNRNNATNDPFAGALEDGQRLVPNPASYSWQSSSGNATPASRSTRLQAPAVQSRSVTPDVPIASFPILQPASNNWSQPIQSSAPTTPAWEGSNAFPNKPANQSQYNAWSQATSPPPGIGSTRLQASSFLTGPTSQTLTYNASPDTNKNTGFAPMLAPPPQSPPIANPWQSQPKSQPFSSFSPSPTSRVSSTTTVPQQQQSTSAKPPPGGLDKYQSLL